MAANITIDKQKVIRQISVSGTEYTIDAPLWDGRTFSDVESMIHGGVETYVIPESSSSISGYDGVVKNTGNTITITKSTLDSLVASGDKTGGYKVGDVILMEALGTDAAPIFDRWVSKVETNNITLTVLETRVQTHHHTVTVPTISKTSANVLTSAAVATTTTSNMAYVGSAVSVVTGVSGTQSVVTSVDHDNNGGHSLTITSGESKEDYGHKHTVDAHDHTVTYDKTTVGSYVSVYTSLSTSSHTPHTHTVVSVAGKYTDGADINYVVDTPKSTDTFIKTLKDATSTTATGGATPGTNAVALTTSTQTSSDTVGDVVKTTSSGTHSHNVTTTTNVDVVTSVSLANKVLTDINYTAPTVAGTVVTAVSLSKSAVSTVTSWAATVDSDGILSFGVSTGDRISSITFTSSTSTQSAGSCTATSTNQTHTSGKVSSTGTAADAGAHQHGFSHTHAIASHSHTVDSHTHTYYKTIASEKASAITGLSTASYTPHTHTNISAAGISTNASAITYVYDGGKTSVVKDLSITATSVTTGSATPGTNTVYQKVDGTITFPGLSLGTKSLSEMLSTKSINPAADSGQKPAMTITTSSASVVGTITVGTSTTKTSTNVGGE